MRFTFWIMVGIVAISGLSQGMLLPAIAMIFEQEGVSSSINGIHATALYIGILVISPFLEKPMQRFGMKPIIVIGGFLVIISLFFFTQTFSFWVWFILRFLVGVGDHMLHVGTQTWITTTSDPSKNRETSIDIRCILRNWFCCWSVFSKHCAVRSCNTIYYIYYTLFNRLAFTTSNKKCIPSAR